MLNALASPEIWAALLTLTALEIVLGIDNVIFLSIIASKLPAEQQARARTLGLAGALLTRVALLFSLSWLASLVRPMLSIGSFEVSGRDMVLFFGGLFLQTVLHKVQHLLQQSVSSFLQVLHQLFVSFAVEKILHLVQDSSFLAVKLKVLLEFVLFVN